MGITKAQEERERTGGLSAEEITAEKARLGVPSGGQQLRSWIRYQLQNKTNPDTAKPYTQADIARATFTSEGSVSYIYQGQRVSGQKSGRVRRLTSQILGIPEAVLFPASADGETSEGGNDNGAGSG